MTIIDASIYNKPFLIDVNIEPLGKLVEFFETFKSFDSKLRENLTDLAIEIKQLEKGLHPYYISLPKDDQIDKYLTWLKDGKVNFDSIYNQVNKIEPSISRILDVLEDSLKPENYMIESYNIIFDLIENCTNSLNDLKAWLISIKQHIDISIDFLEISNNTMDTLHRLIKENLKTCFKIQEERFLSPIRHLPSFSLKQLLDLLNSTNENLSYKIPAFTSIDEVVYREYLELTKKIEPIDLSLNKFLLERINNFKKREVSIIKKLSIRLDEKYKIILEEYNFMTQEIKDLKKELVDKRWNILFINLSHEIEFLMEEIDLIKNKIRNYYLSNRIKEKLIKQLTKKTEIITRTFQVIFKAIELALLDTTVVKRINEISKRWLVEIKSINKIFNKYEEERDSIDDISSRINSLTLRNGKARNAENNKLIDNDNNELLPMNDKHNNKTEKRDIELNQIDEYIKKEILHCTENPQHSSAKKKRRSSLMGTAPLANKEKRISSGNKIGVALLNKMNYQPVIVTGTPVSVERNNPFYDIESINNNQKKAAKRMSKLQFNAVPDLNHPTTKHHSILGSASSSFTIRDFEDEDSFVMCSPIDKDQQHQLQHTQSETPQSPLREEIKSIFDSAEKNSIDDSMTINKKNRLQTLPSPQGLSVLERTLRKLEGSPTLYSNTNSDDENSMLLFPHEDINPFVNSTASSEEDIKIINNFEDIGNHSDTVQLYDDKQTQDLEPDEDELNDETQETIEYHDLQKEVELDNSDDSKPTPGPTTNFSYETRNSLLRLEKLEQVRKLKLKYYMTQQSKIPRWNPKAYFATWGNSDTKGISSYPENLYSELSPLPVQCLDEQLKGSLLRKPTPLSHLYS
ncbi:hypothetical protein TBLA_0A07110 [Henningerozyma blattae CBS 6284]|uniref:Karyogamy protein KAR9 n=1 Tax=Henningerozyma blattae (strain ATCC 34711 / CBS 6284 / DSM 70876 / NBRC 10599 / NRRL Y-10934 / UCD 77-7) TaxID=1071380 RepID=I2GWJ9_HENB6|nr:hypothetical protein TBLA_0A07110 [Tetrapisispora blattae CBS 6284]CCH58501.1 hypothetical protein TBLA_0A07110 [Tetrapisispora blattae CBS 6284]